MSEVRSQKSEVRGRRSEGLKKNERPTSNVEWEKRNGSRSLPAVNLAGSEDSRE